MDGQTPAGRPLPGDDASSAPPRNALAPAPFPEDDLDDGHFEWMVREIEAGRLLPPPESAVAGPAISISLGDASDLDPELLAAMCGPDGFGGQAVSAAFGQGEAADALRPGPVLAALTAQPVSTAGALTDDELIGVLQATQRLANLAAYQQTVMIAEFARRRQAEFEAAKARGVPVGCRAGEFPGGELAMELVASGPYTAGRIDAAIELPALSQAFAVAVVNAADSDWKELAGDHATPLPQHPKLRMLARQGLTLLIPLGAAAGIVLGVRPLPTAVIPLLTFLVGLAVARVLRWLDFGSDIDQALTISDLLRKP